MKENIRQTRCMVEVRTIRAMLTTFITCRYYLSSFRSIFKLTCHAVFPGVYIWAEGARYEGEYKEHKKHGRGLQTWPTGGRCVYRENSRGHRLNSQKNTTVPHTPYSCCEPCAVHSFLAHELAGRRYEGHYVDGTQTGMGIMTWADGRRYEG